MTKKSLDKERLLLISNIQMSNRLGFGSCSDFPNENHFPNDSQLCDLIGRSPALKGAMVFFCPSPVLSTEKSSFLPSPIPIYL